MGESELVDASRDGKSRAVEGFFAQSAMSEMVEGKAQDALVSALNAGVLSGKALIVKALIDGGASAQRTEALHVCIRQGHLSLLSHLVGVASMSVNQTDSNGLSPLHVAAEANQPRAAQFLLKHSASIDATDGEGRTALDIAVACRWKEMQRVLQDPSLLFWNRSARATRLYKEREYESACESYDLALEQMLKMKTPLAPDTASTFFFNFGRSAQSMGRITRASDLFTKVLETAPRHERALDHRAECHASLGDYAAATADLRELTASFASTTAPETVQGWARRMAELRKKESMEAHEVLGVGRLASSAEIKKAYRTACLQHHPDKQANASDDARCRSKHKFARIQAAYEKLSAASSRREQRQQSPGFGYGRPGAPAWAAYEAAADYDDYGDGDDDDNASGFSYRQSWAAYDP